MSDTNKKQTGTIEIQYKRCCYECGHRRTYVDEESIFLLTGEDYVYTTICCEHEEVCKKYLEENR